MIRNWCFLGQPSSHVIEKYYGWLLVNIITKRVIVFPVIVLHALRWSSDCHPWSFSNTLDIAWCRTFGDSECGATSNCYSIRTCESSMRTRSWCLLYVTLRSVMFFLFFFKHFITINLFKIMGNVSQNSGIRNNGKHLLTTRPAFELDTHLHVFYFYITYLYSANRSCRRCPLCK